MNNQSATVKHEVGARALKSQWTRSQHFPTFHTIPNGNLLSVTDAKNQMTSYTYDSMDQLATRRDALNRQETYQYDRGGNLRQVTDRKNQTTTFAYDALNRRTGATYPDATVTFSYDAINRLTSVNDSVGGTITWTYDTVSGGHHPLRGQPDLIHISAVWRDDSGRNCEHESLPIHWTRE